MTASRPLATSTPRLFLITLICAAMVAASGRSIHASSTPAGALFPNTTTNTTSAGIQVDAAGGMHGAYATDPQFQATYTYCPPITDCSKASNWAQATFQNNVFEVQIAVTPKDVHECCS